MPVALLGLYLVLKVSGMTRLAMTVLGGTGLVGLVIGFAFRDIAENFLASILLSVQNPFRYGDLIEVAGYLGYGPTRLYSGNVADDHGWEPCTNSELDNLQGNHQKLFSEPRIAVSISALEIRENAPITRGSSCRRSSRTAPPTTPVRVLVEN